MKPYYLKFKTSDFIKTGNAWRTPVIDLYDNNQYTNYSVRKANYGTDLLGNGVYTGLNRFSATRSEIGYVKNVGGLNRFVDISGRIDILNWNLNIQEDYTANILTSLSIYTADSSSATPYYLHATPALVNDWVSREDFEPGTPIFFIDANRYVFFELNFISELTLSGFDMELSIAIEIDPPVVNGYFAATRKIQDKFPEWMDVREYDPNDVLGTSKATPESIGGKVLNAVAGEWLTDIGTRIQYEQMQQYIDTVDLSQVSWTYRTTGVPVVVMSVIGDGIRLAVASDINEFYNAVQSNFDVFLWNKYTNEIYTAKKYNSFYINYDPTQATPSYTFIQSPYQTWNSIDDIGVTVDLFRIQSATPNGYLEDNSSFRKRILDVYTSPGSVTSTGLKNVLRRELNLWRYSGATPDIGYFGATPDIIEIEDLESDPKYFDPDGMPTQAFKDLVEELARLYPMTWGYFKYNQAWWDADGTERKGFSTIPRRLDATPIAETYLESGVGDGNDMYVFKPKPFTGTLPFTTNLKIRGRQRTTRSEYMPLTFDVKVYGRAAESLYVNPTTKAKFTIEITSIDNSATPSSPSQLVYYAVIDISDINNQTYYAATPTGVLVDWTTLDGYTSAGLQFRNKLTGTIVGQIDLRNVYKVEIKPGVYNGNFATPAYDNIPTQAQYKAWFVATPTTIMGAGGGTILQKTPFNWQINNPSFFFQSQQVLYTGATPGNWLSDTFYYTINLNGVQPNQTQQDYILTLPTIVFPPSTSSREYVIELATRMGTTYGAYADATAATPVFLPYSYINVNANNTWVSNYQKVFATSTTSVTFSSGSGAAYPNLSNVWSLFSSTATYQLTGTIDENGPYRNGQKPRIGNTNYLFSTSTLTRDNFGIPNTIDYIITWIGVDSVSDPNVISWLDSNTVKPAVLDAGEKNIAFVYPDNAILEVLNTTTNKYEFRNLNVYAKVKPGINKQWNPKAYSGWFHDDIDEYYMYANPGTESATGSFKVLSGVNRQGAPILVFGNGSTPMRQVAFFDATPGATPTLGLINTQSLAGNGTKSLYAAYNNIYQLTALDATLGTNPTLSSTTSIDNVIRFVNNTVVGHTYTVSYKVAKSFYADNQYTEASPTGNRTKVVFDKTAALNAFTSYTINYETSIYDPATPIDIPLNGLYTSIDEGFIFIDHDIHPLNQVEVKISPSNITADGKDYALLTINSLDNQGNPKPNQTFTIFTNFGSFDKVSITTDRDGFGSAILTSTSWNGATPIIPATPVLTPATPGTTNQGQIIIDGVVDARLGFGIQIPPTPQYNIIAVLDSDYILSNGQNATYIFGLVENSTHQPLPYAAVYWRKARTIYELFSKVIWSTSQATPGSSIASGLAYADSRGRFSIGPFVSNTVPGYWLASVETGSASPNIAANQFNLVGDVVYWYEHTDITSTMDPITQMPYASIQEATPSWTLPTYSNVNVFPTTYDEAVPRGTRSSATPDFLPPRWWAINKFKQYEMGLYGQNFDVVGATPIYPEYKDF